MAAKVARIIAAVRVVSRRQVAECVTMEEAIAAVRAAFEASARGEIDSPARIALASSAGTTLVMPAASSTVGATVVKVVSVHPGNPGRGLPTTIGLLHVLDAATGEPLAVVEAGLLTAIRTAAASAVATDLLARPEAATLALIGSGFQARYQAEAIARVRRLRTTRVFSPNPARRGSLAVELSTSLGLDARAADSAAGAVREADIVCAATTASDPVFAGADIRPGTHVNGIGSFRLDMGELPVELLERARIIVDSCEAARSEAGDLVRAIEQGRCAWQDVAELGDVLLGRLPGRTSPRQVTVFKSVGLALQDLALGSLVARRATERGLGLEVDLGC